MASASPDAYQSPLSLSSSEQFSLDNAAFFRRLRLSAKTNIVVVSVFSILLVIVLFLLNMRTEALIDQISQRQIYQEAALAQSQMLQTEQVLLKDTELLAAAPGLVEILNKRDVAGAKGFLLSGEVPQYFTDIDLFDTEGERLVDLDEETTTETLNIQEEASMQQALGGLPVSGIILSEEGEDEAASAETEPTADLFLAITAAVPVYNPEMTDIIGVLTTRRVIDQTFLEAFTLNRKKDVALFLIYDGQIIAHTSFETETGMVALADLDQSSMARLLDPASIDEALRGKLHIAEHPIEIQGTPHTLAHVPMEVGGKTEAVFGILESLEPLINFQTQFTNALTVAFALVLLAAVGALSIFVRLSVTRPLHNLQAVVETIAQGDYSQRAPVSSADEVGRLSGAFNAMAYNLGELHSRVNERTVSLTGALAEAQEARATAEQANQMKSQFLATMSHELRTPLNSIINFTRILISGVRGPVNEGQVDYLNRVCASGEHLLGLINDILDLSKIEAGRMELYKEPCQVNELAQHVVATAAGLIKEKPIELHQDIAPNIPAIMVDRTRIRQIMLNLLSNAAKFTDAGAITLRIFQEKDQIIVSLSDTGIGIVPEYLDTIFEEFRQVDGESNRRYGGTGLGLAICQRLVELHGGRIWVESVVGEGSTFSFSLPIETDSPTQMTNIEAPELDTPFNPNAPVVIVIDDDPAAIEIVTSYLKRDGYAVYGVRDSRRALDEARRLRPAAIILDILMPHKDGWEILTELKADTKLQAVPVVLYTIAEERQLGMHLGASAYLLKPIDEAQLRGTVNQLVSSGGIVLVIDDDPDVLEMVSSQLGQTGSCQVITANGGQAGLELVAAQRPDVIILDLMMPDVDGFAVLEQLERNPNTYDIPVVVLTAKDLTADERNVLNRRVRTLLAKRAAALEDLAGKVAALLVKEA
ncbi:MAG: response regulator [Chloroflexales bacterium]|nr:response regulator [Chloroflexales bacterium]